MTRYLVFTLKGPMQSWGTSAAVGEVRSTANHPSRSGVMGLVAAALGIRRSQPDELVRLHQASRLAVRMDRPGDRMVDYHTVQVPPGTKKRVYRTRRDELVSMLEQDEKPATILSRREYLAGAAFTACIWLESDAGHDLDDMREALRHPGLTLYLGRKSCPLGFPLLPEVLEAEDAIAAFHVYDAMREQVPEWDTRPGTQVWTDEGYGDQPAIMTFSTRDVLTNARKRQFDTRTEIHLSLPETEEADHVHE
ncbi:type I-E CRISPR-associated protein Cas5/CasD [Pseudodesulfovibrio tunisiensis]|uniref:type I-E CRISPR-associated protein Cas5/CasD n=1 Tax=Pseudodesulfovibrio tunisiensis TaxID=463192 RepID=UPI001FB2E918|nr:type I-E CRISPR-associated protein Cas5/CasD [Pseudodesulfovibrio tunisiensis]